MTERFVPVGDGHTELSHEDRVGLLPTYISTRGDLFDAEQRNITRALERQAPKVVDLLDDHYLRDLHRAMFGQVWEWAGQYRRRETNIGIDPVAIPGAARSLVDDARVWVESETYDHDELAVRFHHRLVVIHPFPNGNGRHGRIAADYLVMGLGGEAFSWGAGLSVDTKALREAYHGALRQADAGDINALVNFGRS